MMAENKLLAGKYALVTGATRGIGRVIAETLAGAGAHVALTSRQEGECREAARQLAAAHGSSACGAACDVASADSVSRLFKELAEWSGHRLDILINNAGYPMKKQIWNMHLHEASSATVEQWMLDVFRTDCLGAVFCTREALQWMVPAGCGSLVFIASTPALEGYQGTPYTAAKAAILGLMRDLAREYGPHGIRANALALGNIRTSATYDSLDEDTRRALAAESPLGRWGMPEEVARAALFLASDLSSFVTGQTVIVDGGTLRR